MKKIERKWPIGTADNEVVIKETDLNELEQQRDELITRIKKLDKISFRSTKELLNWWTDIYYYFEEIKAGEE